MSAIKTVLFCLLFPFYLAGDADTTQPKIPKLVVPPPPPVLIDSTTTHLRIQFPTVSIVSFLMTDGKVMMVPARIVHEADEYWLIIRHDLQVTIFMKKNVALFSVLGSVEELALRELKKQAISSKQKYELEGREAKNDRAMR